MNAERSSMPGASSSGGVSAAGASFLPEGTTLVARQGSEGLCFK